MDVQMPGMDGVEATRHIRALAGLARPRIVALPANAGAGDRRAYFGAPFMSRLDSTFLRTAAPLVDALRQAAHSLKSSSANVGARAFSALCTDLEHHGRDGQMTSAARLGAALDHAWQSVQEALAPTPPC